jgi:LmbE family N-acetylglucosaminyl deacetylase
MSWSHPGAQIFVPDGTEPAEALRRTTHMGIGAHPDDLEFMAWHGILECFLKPDKWFTGVTVTDGRGSPRQADYAHYSDQEMRSVRLEEQKQAAQIGQYSALVWLDCLSADTRRTDSGLHDDLVRLLTQSRPRVIYTHNLADKHDTHVGVLLSLIAALRALPAEIRPEAVYGCEVWRGLDWLPDELKVVFDVSSHENLTMALMGVYDSQITGGKRYDLATQGRKRANATYFASHSTDKAHLLEFAMDMTPLIRDSSLDPGQYVASLLARFAEDVAARVVRCRI